MLKLTHRLSYLPGLADPDPRNLGFNTFQVAFDPLVAGSVEAAIVWVAAQPNDLDLLLAFDPQPANALFLGKALPASWYETFGGELRRLHDHFGDRVVGLRWNHEYRSSAFAHSSEWEMWLNTRNAAMLQYVIRYQRAKWNQLLNDTKATIHPVAFLEQNTGTPWDLASNADFRTTFRLWCEFQCIRQSVVINELADIAADESLPMYLYPGGKSAISPRLLPNLEYSLDQALVSPNIILEAGGWHDRSSAWVTEVATSMRQQFIWTVQMGQNLIGSDPIREYGDRLASRSSMGQFPKGLGFWCNWTADFVRHTPLCVEYLNRLREVLRAL